MSAILSFQAKAQVLDEAAARRSVLPFIRATSDCMAREALRSNGLVEASRNNDWNEFLKGVAPKCADQINTMIRAHDTYYGAGRGLTFFQGPYMDDLPRAIKSRAQTQIDQKLAEADRIERERQREAALQEAERKAELERRQNEIMIAQQKREAEKAIALDTAKRAMGILRDKLYNCTDKNLQDLVRSGEGAEVLASAVMTICRTELDSTLQSAIEAYKIDSGINYVNETQQMAMRADLSKTVKERIIAAAVQAKAAAASMQH